MCFGVKEAKLARSVCSPVGDLQLQISKTPGYPPRRFRETTAAQMQMTALLCAI